MKRTILIASQAVLLCTSPSFGQGTFTYDQQSSSNETPPAPGDGGAIQAVPPPWGQSFTPSLDTIGFIRLMLDDGNLSDGLGASLHVNLRAGSIGGGIIGTTRSATLASGFAGPVTFLFPGSIALIPGTAYYLEPVVESGGTWNIISGPYDYAGGTVFTGGVPATGSDLWFREGVLVPEPSSVVLYLLGLGAFALTRIRHAAFHRPLRRH